MNKKSLSFALMMLVLFSLGAAPLLQLGGSMAFNMPFDPGRLEDITLESISWSDYEAGLDARANISFFTLQGEIRGSFTEDLLLESYALYASGNIRADLFFLSISAGIGFKASVEQDEESGDWSYNGQDRTGLWNVFSTSSIYYRAGAGLNLGPVSVSLQAMLPIGESIRTLDEVKERSVMEALTPDFSKTRVSASLLFNFL